MDKEQARENWETLVEWCKNAFPVEEEIVLGKPRESVLYAAARITELEAILKSHKETQSQRITELEQQLAQPWTDASQELPDDDTRVLVVIADEVCEGYIDFEKWWINDEAYELEEITHWQHLPPAPEG